MPGNFEMGRAGGSSVARAARVGRRTVCSCGLCAEATSFASSLETEMPAEVERPRLANSASRSSPHTTDATASRAAHLAARRAVPRRALQPRRRVPGAAGALARRGVLRRGHRARARPPSRALQPRPLQAGPAGRRGARARRRRERRPPSSSVSSASPQDSPPSTTSTWQVEQALTPPQAWSISRSLPRAMSRMEPGLPSRCRGRSSGDTSTVRPSGWKVTR